MPGPVRHRLSPLMAVGLLFLLGVATGCTRSSASPLEGAAPSSSPASSGPPSKAITIAVKSDAENARLGPDGSYHDAFVPSQFTLSAGVPVTITIYNYDDMPHSFTSPPLGLDEFVPMGDAGSPSKVTFTFTPTKPGVYVWYCATPCDDWAMTHDFFMLGNITVTA